ncbi:hypothetical protein ABPG72_000873 [Tetrahymena utriculariae]
MRQNQVNRQHVSNFSNSKQRKINSNPIERQERKSQLENNLVCNKLNSNIFNFQQMKQIYQTQDVRFRYEDAVIQDKQTHDDQKAEPIDLKSFLRKGEIYFMYGSFLIYTIIFLTFILLVYGIYKIYLNFSNNYCENSVDIMNICKLSNGYIDVSSNQSYIIQVILFICLTVSQITRFKLGIYDIFEILTNKYLIDQIKAEKSPTSYTVKISNIKQEDNLEENILLYFDLLMKPRVKIRCITFCYDMKIIDKLDKINKKAKLKSYVNFLQQRLVQKIINRQEKEIKSQDLFNGIAYITFDSREEKQQVLKYRKDIIYRFSQLWNTEGEYLQKYRKLKQQMHSSSGKTIYQPSEWYEGISISEPEQPCDIIWSNQLLSRSKLIPLWMKVVSVIIIGIVTNIVFIFLIGNILKSQLESYKDSGSTSSKSFFIILSIIIPLFSQIVNKFIRFLIYGGFKQIFSQKSTICLIYVILLPIIQSFNEVIFLAILQGNRICQMQIEWMNMFINLLYPLIQTSRMFNFKYNINLSNLVFGNQSSYIQFKNIVTRDKEKKQIKISLWYIFVVKIFYNTIAICQTNPFSIIFYIATVSLTLFIQKMLLKSNYLKQNFCSSDLCRVQDFQFSIGLLVISITQISHLQRNQSQGYQIQLALNLLTVISTFIYTVISLYKYINNKRALFRKDEDDKNYQLEMELSSVDSKSSYTQQIDQVHQKIEDLELKYSYFQLNPVNQYMAEQRESYVKLLKQKQLGQEGRLSQQLFLDGRLSLTRTQDTLIKILNQICLDYEEIQHKGKDEMYRQPDKKNDKVSKQFSEFEQKSFFIEDSILNLINIYLEISKSNVSIKKQTVFLNSQLSSQLLGKFNQNIY